MTTGVFRPARGARRLRMVRRVSALVWEGHSDLTMHGAHVGVVGLGLWPAVGVSTHRGTQVSSLAQVLSPPPAPPPRAAWWVWITIVALYCACWVGIGVWAWQAPSRPPDVSVAEVVVTVAAFLAPGLAIMVLLVPLLVCRLRRDRLWRQAMPAMAEVWQGAWYCGRCGGAFLDSPAVPADLRRRLVAPPGLRDLVYLAGVAIRHGPHRAGTD